MSADAVQKMDKPCLCGPSPCIVVTTDTKLREGYYCDRTTHLDFEQWWDTEVRFGRLFLGSGDYWVSKGIAKKAWLAAKESR